MKKAILIKVLIIVILCCFYVPRSKAAFNPFLRPINNFSINLLGDATIISLSYERLLSSNRKFFLAGKIGAGYSESRGLPVKNTSLLSTPMHLTGNYGEKKNYFEFGLGATLLFYGDFEFWDYVIYPIVGYRLQPLKNDRFTFRVFLSYPVTGKIDIDKYWFSPVGVSIGFCFK